MGCTCKGVAPCPNIGNTGIGTRQAERATVHYKKRSNLFVSCISSITMQKFERTTTAVGAPLSGKQKVKIYHYAMPAKMSWDLKLYHLPQSFIQRSLALQLQPPSPSHSASCNMCLYVCLYISKCASAPNKNTTCASYSRWWPHWVQVHGVFALVDGRKPLATSTSCTVSGPSCAQV